MKEDVAVSLIIAAYNVEKYISKCLTSIVEQTYSNIEIIVVDDGSKDSTAEILDRFADEDVRIHVIHKENGGVSAARNTGLEVAKGEYIVFVDGDDYLAPDYVEYMLALVKKTNAEMCLSKVCFTRSEEEQITNEGVEILSPDDATALLLSPAVIVGCWDKIYKRSFLEKNKLRFLPELFYGEGLQFITAAAQRSNCVGVGNRKVYFYRRNNQESATSRFNIEKIYNGERSIKLIEETLIIKSPQILTMLKLHKSIFCLGAVVRIQSFKLKREYIEDYCRWLRIVKRTLPELLFSKRVPLYRKMMLLGGCVSPWFLARLDNVRRKGIYSSSID